jgi:hypothetical protein
MHTLVFKTLLYAGTIFTRTAMLVIWRSCCAARSLNPAASTPGCVTSPHMRSHESHLSHADALFALMLCQGCRLAEGRVNVDPRSLCMIDQRVGWFTQILTRLPLIGLQIFLPAAVLGSIMRAPLTSTQLAPHIRTFPEGPHSDCTGNHAYLYGLQASSCHHTLVCSSEGGVWADVRRPCALRGSSAASPSDAVSLQYSHST